MVSGWATATLRCRWQMSFFHINNQWLVEGPLNDLCVDDDNIPSWPFQKDNIRRNVINGLTPCFGANSKL